MKDGPDTRARILEGLASIQGATHFAYKRFRRHTLGSAAGHALDVVADELMGDEHVVDGPRVRPGAPGVLLVAYGARDEIGRYEVHPVQDDFESEILPALVGALARLGASASVFAGEWQLSLIELASVRGLRELAPMPDPKVLEDVGYQVDMERGVLRWVEELRPLPLAGVGVVALGVACFPVTLACMLFREPREVLLGLGQRCFHGWSRTWTLTLDGTQLHVVAEETGAERQTWQHSLSDARWVGAWPGGYAEKEGQPQVMLIGDRVERIEVPAAPAKVADLLEAARRRL